MNSRGTVGNFTTKFVHDKNNLCIYTILFMMNVLHIFHTGWNNFVLFLLTDHAWSKCLLLFSLKIIIHMNLTVIMIKLQSNNYYCKSGCCVHNFSVKLLCK